MWPKGRGGSNPSFRTKISLAALRGFFVLLAFCNDLKVSHLLWPKKLCIRQTAEAGPDVVCAWLLGGLNSPLRRFGDDERNVVVLLVRAEPLNLIDNSREQLLRRKSAMAAKGGNQALFAKFFVSGVKRFGDAVGVKGKRIARAKNGLADCAIPVLEDAEDRGRGFEPFERIVGAQEKSGKVAAVGIAQAA